MTEAERQQPAPEPVGEQAAGDDTGAAEAEPDTGAAEATPGPDTGAADATPKPDATVPAVDHLDDPAVDAPATHAGSSVAPQPPEESPADDSDGWDLLAAVAEGDPRSKAELLAELVEAEARRDEYLDDVRRARAEFENYRKRIMREGATQRELGKATAVEGMLEALDDLDRTLEAAAASDDQSLARGVELMAAKLVQALQALGLERIDTTGVPFDPSLHEAVQQQKADEPSGEPVVRQVLRPGYRLGDRVLRAAMVVVEQ